ncbi:protein transport protein SEC31 homolog B-like [Ipomoea triloba]|uniref:protein transport protein SEC31 homolog B-like n=1 Tax=Ipomoea triloba TaxID=35885 RepID=UPI00125DA992|nr:protein transport protein SEC31 homolog B-like [Ipomoea triloba]
MAFVKVVNRSASASFAPEGPYLAAGTMAGAVDLSFSSSANLDIFKLDFGSDDQQLILAGSVTSSERFNRLSWGKALPNSEQFSLGLIAGGLVDGHIGLWNPRPLISSGANQTGTEATENAFVGHLSKHSGPVHGLEFNAFTPNLLASGADEGEICIWDISRPAEPTHFPPLKGSGSSTQVEISYLSWNSKVQHVLASTSLNGTTVVWDLRKQKPVISFSDSVRRRCSVLQWHPDFATQLIVASDEDSSPALRMWDMRNVMSPVKEFVGHTKGVIAMSWCPIDSSYLLTCAKDNRTICWDVVSGEIVSELPEGTNWNFDVHWYSKCPGVILASSFDGKMGIYNIEGCGRCRAEESASGAASLRAPKWYKRKSGVSFGFGGKLVSFHSTNANDKPSEVCMQNVDTEHGLASRSSDFEAAIQNGQRSSLRILCEKKSQESESGDERETWGFLKVMFEDDGTARTKLLSHLGFSVPVEKEDTTQNEISEQASALGIGESLAGGKEGDNVKKDTMMQLIDNGEDFFNNLPSPKTDTPVSTSASNFATNEAAMGWEEAPLETNGADESDASFDDAVQRVLVVGNYKAAVELCISANKMADALVIAHVGGTSLWESTRDQYLKTSRSSYLKVVFAMVNNDLKSLVNTRPLKSWKETLALFCTFAQQDEWTLLCDTLASRLFAAGETLPATLCYICAGNIDKTIEIWSRTLAEKHDGKSYIDLLQDLMEKTIVFALATGQKRFSATLCKLVEKYAEILASQGLLTTAMEYLKLLGTEELSHELMILRERIALSIEPDKGTVKSMEFDRSQMQTWPAHSPEQTSYGMLDASQQYYPEPQPQLTTSGPSSQYADSYQPSLGPSYKGYVPPAPYQQAPPQTIQQPNIFVPTPAPHIPQGSVAPPPIPAQSTVKPFIPTNPPALKHVEQYQQPTLGSQLYPGSAHPSYPPGPPGPGTYGFNPSPVQTLGQKMPQVVAPSPSARGFTPVTGPAGVQRPSMSPVQPASPTQATVIQPPVAAAAPPPTVQTVDTSNVPGEQKAVVTTLTRLFNETSEALGGQRANPAKKREIEDNSKKLGALFAKLNSGDISKNAAEKLVQLCRALDNGDFGTALQIQVLLTTSDWDECNFWLATLKRMIKMRQSFR